MSPPDASLTERSRSHHPHQPDAELEHDCRSDRSIHRLSILSEEGKEAVIAILTAGQFVGEGMLRARIHSIVVGARSARFFCLFALTVLKKVDSDLVAVDPSQFAATKGETR
jgi:hypothetical protein